MSIAYSNIDVDESEDQVSAVAVDINWLHVINLTAAVIFLKLYNGLAADIVVGTDTPLHTFPVPAQSDSNGGGFTINIQGGIQFSSALTVAATIGIAVANTGAPAANGLVLNMGYSIKT